MQLGRGLAIHFEYKVLHEYTYCMNSNCMVETPLILYQQCLKHHRFGIGSAPDTAVAAAKIFLKNQRCLSQG
jgi:hypothetical protein